MASTDGIRFQRPIGAPADTNELEYVAALHQTELKDIRVNGTVNAKDIRNYLTSRHGVYVDHTVLEKRIIKELCGTFVPEDDQSSQFTPKKNQGDEEPQAMMDLCQMVALLCIPFLRQEDINEAAKGNNPLTHGMAENVMKLILEELELNGVDITQFRAVDENFETGTRITPKLVQDMLETYGEYHVPQDILKEMVRACGENNTSGSKDDDGSGSDSSNNDSDDEESQIPNLKTQKSGDQAVIMWNKDSFQRALTADIQLYQPSFEKQQTTILADVRSIDRDKNRPQDDDNIPMQSTFNTAPSIDQAAEQYRSFLWMILLWISFLLYYMCYVFDRNGVVSFTGCSESNAFGCNAASAVVNCLTVFAQFGISGSLYIILGSLGNSSKHKDELGSQKASTGLGILVAMGVVASATIVPNFIEGKVFVWDIVKVDGWEALYWGTFALGVLLIMLQFIRLVDNFVGVGALGKGGVIRTEQSIKDAATKKVNVMMDNAMLLHVTPMIAGQKPKGGKGWRFPAKHASEIVIKHASDLHEEKDSKKLHYRDGTNIEALTGGDGSERALRHYKAMRDVTETVGGILWAYERMADGRLFDEEGIWFSARLMTSNAVQWMVVAAIAVTYVVAWAWFEEQKANTVAVGQRRLEEETKQEDSLREYIMEYERALQKKQRHERQLQRHERRQRLHRRLQYIQPVNSTHYSIAGQAGTFPNLIYDINSTHFTDGTTTWPYATNSHNGTHVFDKYFAYNETGFTDGNRFYPYASFATNGTHISNGEYLFDGTTIMALPGNSAVNNVEDWEFRVGLSVGLAAALAATIGIAVVFMPSMVSTVLKFRSGVFKSLRGNDTFQQLRESPARVTGLLGSAIWGSVFTGFFCAFFAGGISFLSVWSETRSTALRIYALLIGVVAIWFVNFLATRLFRDLYVSFFYRRHPAAVNFINVLLESSNLPLAIGLMFLRSVKLLAVTICYIGRIDVPTFAPGVGYVGSMPLDSEHFGFKNDLLIHEAHRHPYMERLGLVYLMKLYHGKSFGSRAGAYWRMLFVLALMPHLRQYRIRHFEEKKPDRGDEDEDDNSHQPTVRLADDSSVMSLHGIELEVDVVKRANESLTKRNKDLKQSVEDLRARLRAANKEVAKLERRVERERTRSKAKKSGPSTVDGPRKAEQRSKVQQEVNDIDDDDETFKSESDHRKIGAASMQESMESREEFEDDFNSDTEEDTFSIAVAKERAKLEEQKRQSMLRDKTKGNTGPISLQSSFVSEYDEDFESEDDETEPLKEVLRGRSAEPPAEDKKASETSSSTSNVSPASQRRAAPDAETDDEFEDEFEEAKDESLTHLLKKNKAQKEAADRQARRDPD